MEAASGQGERREGNTEITTAESHGGREGAGCWGGGRAGSLARGWATPRVAINSCCACVTSVSRCEPGTYTAVVPKIPHSKSCKKSAKIGLYDSAEADLELFCNSWSAGFLGERLYIPIEHLWQVLRMAFVAPHRCLAAGRCLGCVPDAQSTGSLPRSRPDPSENKTACGASCSSVRCSDDTLAVARTAHRSEAGANGSHDYC